ncbi:hypothetical protein TWF106_005104 [Orbilia oligospora]|uniref:Uncharacterized protein n=1 Tax=Orbilia oligospora TaxID=2813651 RepID=A0A6G1ME81_ORBOL|nr:hypothetical protein TWF788_007923 [Orbilia oligospora]KAF3217108.1 hypothetical protein TWF191_008786 [Orbilia oligospora]KAF3222438.1 hypothetical protein TWF679_005919 [Orbilia oligospora]KAF3223330.1 hypothetical protein TWF106_005104 [Orbilia oligospora]KAF3253560.1 hypothetical protein TWF192_003814 [Orbilia oligospora]
MPNSSNCSNTPSRLAQAIDEDEQRIHSSESGTLSNHEVPSTHTARYPLQQAPVSSPDNELSFSGNYRKRAASRSSSEGSGPLSSTNAPSISTRINLPKRQRRAPIPSAPSSQPLASLSFEFSSNSSRAAKVRQFMDDDYHCYHPKYSPCIPVAQRASWPLIESTPGIFEDRIEVLDTALGASGGSVDSGLGLNEYNTEAPLSARPSGTLDLAYIGAWSYPERPDPLASAHSTSFIS